MKNTIKVIDIYNLIANKEYEKLPQVIKYEDDIYELIEEKTDYVSDKLDGFSFFNRYLPRKLNDEVEILNKKRKNISKFKIRELGEGLTDIQYSYKQCNNGSVSGVKSGYLTTFEKVLFYKMNELIDAVNEMRKNETNK